ncbi:hypothetical protein FGO68_gene14304 [Halteria grandinella]|uniref:DNA2/NAM7 helicase-like C-terminal domain-containing protein n=1 Tax=Halteria grandinella TaxID=5974 RepID=A0A8J8P1S2_HALGN|nr:hypothetical protein FGO68_gene14304 [Halteria grandinella]
MTTQADIKFIASFAVNFELNEIGALIRKKVVKLSHQQCQAASLPLAVSENYLLSRNPSTEKLNNVISLLGFVKEAIRNLTIDQFNSFMNDKFNQEELILRDRPIIITTFNCYMNSSLSNIQFQKVIVYEAQQASEIEILMAAQEVEELVLVGDHKQPGPIYKVDVPKCGSLFSRLIEAGYPITVTLNECYTLHPSLLTIPNNLFYDGQIVSFYTHSYATEFISRDKPMLFIHSESPEDSFTNEGECVQIMELLKFIHQCKLRYKEMGFVSLYAGQTNKLRQHVEHFGMGESVRSIEDWQGRNTDVMIMSAVRSNKERSFIEDERRLNVALTRARHGLIIIGNSNTLKLDQKWDVLIRIYKARDCFAVDLDHAKEMISERSSVAETLKPLATPKTGGAGCSEMPANNTEKQLKASIFQPQSKNGDL